MQCKYNSPMDAQRIVWNRFSTASWELLIERNGHSISHMRVSERGRKETLVPAVKCERVRRVKMMIRGIYRDENEGFHASVEFQFHSRSRIHAAECGIIFISFRTSPKSFRRLSHPAPPSPSASFSPPPAEPRARIIRYRIGPSLSWIRHRTS